MLGFRGAENGVGISLRSTGQVKMLGRNLRWRSMATEWTISSISAILRVCQKSSASEFLCAFAAHRACTVAGGTICNEMSAVHAWHTLNNVPYLSRSCLSYVLKGCDNLAPDSSRKPPHPPITCYMLEILYKHLDKDSPFDACCAFMASVAVWGQIRLGELLSNTLTKWDPTHIPSGHHMGPPSSKAGSRILHL